MHIEERLFLVAAAIILIVCPLVLLIPAEPKYHAETILVGTGCVGEHDIAVAYEEDAMPTCEAIEVHYVR